MSSTYARRTTRPAPSRPACSSSAGRVGAHERRDHPVRCRLRGVHLGSGAAALDLRDRRRARVRTRAPQLLQARRVHRRALRVHGGAEDGHRRRPRWHARPAQRPVGAPPHDEVQRRVLHRAARRCGRVLARGARTNGRADRVLHGERAPASRGTRRRRVHDVRRRPRPYIWLRTRNNASSWEFFDRLLEEVQIVGTPGAGFGPAGEGYFGCRPSTRERTSRKRSVEFAAPSARPDTIQP